MEQFSELLIPRAKIDISVDRFQISCGAIYTVHGYVGLQYLSLDSGRGQICKELVAKVLTNLRDDRGRKVVLVETYS